MSVLTHTGPSSDTEPIFPSSMLVVCPFATDVSPPEQVPAVRCKRAPVVLPMQAKALKCTGPVELTLVSRSTLYRLMLAVCTPRNAASSTLASEASVRENAVAMKVGVSLQSEKRGRGETLARGLIPTSNVARSELVGDQGRYTRFSLEKTAAQSNTTCVGASI